MSSLETWHHSGSLFFAVTTARKHSKAPLLPDGPPPYTPHLHLSLHRVKRIGERLGYGGGQADIGKVLEGREPISGSIPEFLQVHVN